MVDNWKLMSCLFMELSIEPFQTKVGHWQLKPCKGRLAFGGTPVCIVMETKISSALHFHRKCPLWKCGLNMKGSPALRLLCVALLLEVVELLGDIALLVYAQFLGSGWGSIAWLHFPSELFLICAHISKQPAKLPLPQSWYCHDGL